MNRATLDSTCTLLLFECEGCGCSHGVPIVGPKKWEWNGSLERPTLSPSVSITWEGGEPKRKLVCHFNVTDGQIVFHGDTTHALRGTTRPLPEVEP